MPWKDRLKFAAVGAWSAACDRLAGREQAAGADGWRGWRVAFVKSSAYRDLYTDPAATTPADLVASSTQRTGPLGLFTSLGARFLIVHEEPAAPETRVFLQRHSRPGADSPQHVRTWEGIKERQRAVAVRADDVDWSAFDLVVAMENAVPSRIVRRFPGVVWATMMEDKAMPAYREAWRRPVDGYHLFFNLRSGPAPWPPARPPHVIDFSYGFQASGSILGLFPGLAKEDRVHVEDHQPPAAETPGGAAMPYAKATGGRPLREYLRHLVRSRVLFAPEPDRPLGGLAAIDAAAADTLFVGNRRALWNPYVTLPALHCRTLAEGRRLVDRILGDPAWRASLLAAQRARLDAFVFHRPLAQIARWMQVAGRSLAPRR